MITVGGEGTLKRFKQIKWSYTSTCDFAQFTLILSVLQNVHLYVSHAALAPTSLIRRRFRFAGPAQKHAARHTPPIGHTAGTCMDVCFHLIPPIAVQSAGPSWQPLWGSPNIAMAYVHINCGEWRRLFYTMLRLVARKTPSNRATERGNNAAAPPLHISNTYILFLYSVAQQGEKKPRAVLQESVACTERGRTELEAHKVCVTCSSTRGLNIYLFVTQGSLSLQPKAL